MSEVHWLTISQAAVFLATSPSALRRALERSAVTSPDGVTEAERDGVRGRKLGRAWRVWIGSRWAAPYGAGASASVGPAPADLGLEGDQGSPAQVPGFDDAGVGRAPPCVGPDAT